MRHTWFFTPLALGYLLSSCNGDLVRPPLPLSPITRDELPSVSLQEEWNRFSLVETPNNAESLSDVKEVLQAELAPPRDSPRSMVASLEASTRPVEKICCLQVQDRSHPSKS